MADTSLKLVHSSTPAVSPEPITLHNQAHNALTRCMHELWADPVNYDAACRHVAEASTALRALAGINATALS